MAQQLRVLVALSECSGVAPSTHEADISIPNFSVRGFDNFFYPLQALHTCGAHICRQNSHIHNKINDNKDVTLERKGGGREGNSCRKCKTLLTQALLSS